MSGFTTLRGVAVRSAMWGALAGAAIPNASATNFGSTGTQGAGGTNNGVWLIFDSYFVIGKRALGATADASVDAAYTSLNSTTDIIGFTQTYGSSCETAAADAAYESCFFDDNYGNNNLLGWNACFGSVTGTHPNQVCSIQFTRLNTAYSANGSLSQYNACHEMAHTVGLRHSTDSASCLMTFASGGSSSTLTAHDRAHVNAQY